MLNLRETYYHDALHEDGASQDVTSDSDTNVTGTSTNSTQAQFSSIFVRTSQVAVLPAVVVEADLGSKDAIGSADGRRCVAKLPSVGEIQEISSSARMHS